ncbi:MAG: hypothetical protein KKH29_00450 [Candidatus Omnitrophica bacterium]|nr:hypothetical protein [Candidatus Omnitrophota bacterium]MBU4345780.1 hypothetical protein [Candidatus Omnitrophota bacterium]MBU4473461.1 hypothetical protein [Candidatus Omnitrophota bacterium]MCG2706204.1 hypothetical protein [Candidatus Omnitrophota bacterium]
MLEKWFGGLSKDAVFKALKESFLPYLNELKKFQFAFMNPLFWVVWLALFLVLSRLWNVRKSFSFCLIIAIILLATTRLEALIAAAVIREQGTFEPLLFRILPLTAIVFISIYYFFIRND